VIRTSSPDEDIALLRLDAIAEGADLVAMYAAGAVDAALDGDVELLECALRCMVMSVDAAMLPWREMGGCQGSSDREAP
jgi:hypothetical protein